MRHSSIAATLILLAGGCGQSPDSKPDLYEPTNVSGAAESSTPTPPVEAAPELPAPVTNKNGSPVEVGTPGTPGGLPDDRTPLEEPGGPIDPKSAEGAGQVVQRYGGLLEARRFAEARKLWGDGGKDSGLTEAQFVAAYAKYATIHSEVGKPFDMEGAAGSSYITVPFRLYGTLKSGGPFNIVGPLTLRRVNDVPGSSEAQRRWHIEQSGLKPRP
jgi:hypothetical protein